MRALLEVSLEILPLLLKGILRTVQVSFLSLLLGSLIGLAVGLGRTSGLRLLSWPLVAYVSLARGTPFLVQLFVIFYVLPEYGLELEPMPAAITGLTLYAGAYIGEIVRAGIESIPRGQMEAAASLGLGYAQRMRYVILPQAIRLMIPPLVGQYVLLIKDTSVISVIGVTEVTRYGWEIVQRVPKGLLIFGWVAALYFAVCYPLLLLSAFVERRLRRGRP